MILLQVTEVTAVYDKISNINNGRDALALIATALTVALYMAIKRIVKLEATDKARIEKENLELKQKIELLIAQNENNKRL